MHLRIISAAAKLANKYNSQKRNIPFSKSIFSGLVAMFDLLLIFGAGLVILAFYPGWGTGSFSIYVTTITVFAIITIGTFYYTGMYDIENIAKPKNQYRKIFLIISIATSLIIVFAFVQKSSHSYSRIWLFSWFIANVGLISIARVWVYFVIKKWARDGVITQNLAIIGTNELRTRLIKFLESQRDPWIRIIGIFDSGTTRTQNNPEEHDIKGGLENLIADVRQKRIDNVIVAMPWTEEERLLEIIDKLEELPVGTHLCSDMATFNYLNHSYSYYGGVPVLDIHDKPMTGWGYVLKTIEDKILSALALFLLSPLFVIIALTIKLDSPGPIFFKQRRYGFNHKLIEILKFRTMKNDSQDTNAEKLVTVNDPRVTRIGGFLRKYSLDEIPQFINVLKGDMSIVGPRPHATKAKAAGKLYQDHVDRYAIRHKVKPGITGWAQVNGWRGETNTEEQIRKRVEYDMYYIKHWTPIFDIQIMIRTVWAVACPPKNNH